ncbi:MAG: amidohydrolase [Anaerolineae bacterium]|nr:amidohydrolase [Anaerolineae bacterium]
MIDFHTHPVLVEEMVIRYPELEKAAREVFFIGNRLQPLETFLLELDISGLQRAVLLPLETTRTRGLPIYSNEQIAELVAMAPERFVGFASVDPLAPDAPDRLERAVADLGLRGLKLSPPSQEFYPGDRAVYPLYERAQALGIPVIIHAGMSWEPRARLVWGHPLHLEPVLADFPHLRIVATHFAWPWSLEVAALALRYPNLYVDTAALYFDNPDDFITDLLVRRVPLTLIEHSLRHQVVFGSNYPRVEIKNMARAVRRVGLSEKTLTMVFEENALRLLGDSER